VLLKTTDPFDVFIEALDNKLSRDNTSTYSYSVVKTRCTTCGEPAMFSGHNYCKHCYWITHSDSEPVSRVVVQGAVDPAPAIRMLFGPELIRHRQATWEVIHQYEADPEVTPCDSLQLTW
jgi:hypothetical protein